MGRGHYETFGISFMGALVAGVAGFTMGAGYSLLKDEAPVGNNNNNNNDKNNQLVLRRATGGALLVLGLYLWSPSFLRDFWLRSMYQ